MLLKKIIILTLISSIFITATSAEPENTFESYFPDIEGFTKTGKIDVYNPDNLYDKIDGAADMYLNYGFKELAVLTYENSGDQSVSVEIYCHENADFGFGIYSLERFLGTTNFIDVGTQGYYESGILNFFKDCYYVKISAYNLEDEENKLIQIGSEIASRLPGDKGYPEIFNIFPERNRIVNYERYESKDFMGYSFFRNAYSCYYRMPEANDYFTFFILKGGSKEECKAIMSAYFTDTKYTTEKIKEGMYMVNDPNYGLVGLLWKKDMIRGTFGLEDADLSRQYLENKFDLPEVVKVKGNVAFKKPATSSSIESNNHIATFATDGSLGTRWSSSFSDPQWVCIDLKKTYTIHKVVLLWEGAFGKSYKIQTSLDNENWETVYGTEESDGETDEISFDPVNARYVRMYGEKRATPYGYSIFEFQVFKEK